MAAICEFLGAVLLGASVTSTIKCAPQLDCGTQLDCGNLAADMCGARHDLAHYWHWRTSERTESPSD